MKMKLYFECNLFEEDNFKANPSFDVTQDEIVLSNVKKNGDAIFQKQKVKYKCQWRMQKDFSPERPTIIMPSRNMSDLLKKTTKNLEEKNIVKHCNLILVDDRSDEDLEVIAKDYSYLRIDNEKGFNFSMLNNIGIMTCHNLGSKQAIIWNNDLWAVSENNFLELLSRHNTNNSSASGTKLIYPPKELSFISTEDSSNILEFFPTMSGKWRGTVQYAGTSFFPLSPKIQTLSPYHYKRFKQPEDPTVNCDKGVDSLTGALMIVEIQDFIKVGGFNPSLSKNFQDTDFCLKLIEDNKKCYYFGKDLFFYHDESVSLSGSKIGDKQLTSDEILFGKIWNNKISKMVF